MLLLYEKINWSNVYWIAKNQLWVHLFRLGAPPLAEKVATDKKLRPSVRVNDFQTDGQTPQYLGVRPCPLPPLSSSKTLFFYAFEYSFIKWTTLWTTPVINANTPNITNIIFRIRANRLKSGYRTQISSNAGKDTASNEAHIAPSNEMKSPRFWNETASKTGKGTS